MYYPLTDRQTHYVEIARKLVPGFAAGAAEHDRSGTFPYENYAAIRAAGLPAMVVPEEYGGWGANLLESVMLVEELAIGDGSTALSFTMHLQTLGAVAESRNWPEALFEMVCRDAVTRGALVNSCATEPELGSPSRGGKPKTTATPVEGRAWAIRGRKSFASMSPVLDYLIIPALLQDGTEDVARFVVPSNERVEVVETWDAMGMRSTGSHDVVLHDVVVPENYILGRSNSTKPTRGGKTNAWFMLIVSAAYLGVARAGLQAVARYANERVPTALGKPIAELESIQRRIGQAELLLHEARIQLYHNADLWDRLPDKRVELSPSVGAAKIVATNRAIEAVDLCMRVAGGAGMTRALRLEQYYRDVRGGPTHPLNDEAGFVNFGKSVLQEFAGK